MAAITDTVGTSGRDYSTITLCEASYSAHSGDDMTMELYDDSDFNEAPTINDTNPASITIKSATGERHDGTVTTGVNLILSGNFNIDRACRVEGLIINCNSSATRVDLNADGLVFANNILHNMQRNNSMEMLRLDDFDADIFNNFIYDGLTNGTTDYCVAILVGFSGGATARIYNNTIFDIENNAAGSGNDAWGIKYIDSANINIRNNAVFNVHGTATGDFNHFEVAGSVSSATVDYNVSEDTSAPGANSLHSKTSANNLTSTVGGSEDLHLKSGADCIGAGVDLGTTPSGVEIDIDGRNRDSEVDTWDIGADQFVSSGVTGTTAQSLPSLEQSASASEVFTGTTAQTLPSLSQNNTAVMQPAGTMAQNLASLSQSVAALESFTATAGQELPLISQAASGTVISATTGAIAQVLPSLSESAGASVEFTGATAQTLASINQSISANVSFSVVIAQALPNLSQVISAIQKAIGTLGQSLPSLSQAISGLMQPSATVAQELPSLSQSIVATYQASGILYETIVLAGTIDTIQALEGNLEILILLEGSILTVINLRGDSAQVITLDGDLETIIFLRATL